MAPRVGLAPVVTSFLPRNPRFLDALRAFSHTGNPLVPRPLPELLAPCATKTKHPQTGGILFLLALLNQFRTFDWASEYKYPTVLLSQMNQLLAECKEG